MHLNETSDIGDIMVEARDKKLDKKLKANYRFFYENGTAHMHKDDMQRVLSSRELKLERKEANVPGLQLADVFAHPASIAQSKGMAASGSLKRKRGPIAPARQH